MHPRNRYRDQPPDFAVLAQGHPALAQYLAPPDHVLNASEPGAVEALVTALLRVDFNISSYEGVPTGYLVPSVTRSLNYLHLVEDLLVEAQAKHVIAQGAGRRRGLDVGVGASCIFPLLGCALHPEWEFVGVDVNPQALERAKSNSACFGERICLLHSDLLDGVPLEEERFDFVLCNPPFFSTPPGAEYRPFGGTELERSCEGGEVAFVSKLVAQSALHAKRIVWFSSMLGVKESLREVLAVLHHIPLVSTIRVHRLEQGHTYRWLVCWSFHPELSVGAVFGSTVRVSNLGQATLERRIEEALQGLRHYSVDTGVCGGPGYRFRLRVVVLGPDSCRVDVLDVVGADAAKAARSAQHRAEQDIARTSRKWRKKA